MTVVYVRSQLADSAWSVLLQAFAGPSCWKRPQSVGRFKSTHVEPLVLTGLQDEGGLTSPDWKDGGATHCVFCPEVIVPPWTRHRLSCGYVSKWGQQSHMGLGKTSATSSWSHPVWAAVSLWAVDGRRPVSHCIDFHLGHLVLQHRRTLLLSHPIRPHVRLHLQPPLAVCVQPLTLHPPSITVNVSVTPVHSAVKDFRLHQLMSSSCTDFLK